MNRWLDLSKRERQVVLGGLGTALLSVIYFAAEPVLETHRRYRDELPSLQADLAWMEAQLPRVAALQANVQPGGAIDARVRTAATQSGIRMADAAVTTRAGAVVHVELADVAFANLVRLLATLERLERLSIVALEVVRGTTQAGQVDVAFDVAAGSDS
jgi:type II secretory pathway component PulM